jgi:hypothetical protein
MTVAALATINESLTGNQSMPLPFIRFQRPPLSPRQNRPLRFLDSRKIRFASEVLEKSSESVSHSTNSFHRRALFQSSIDTSRIFF